MLPAFFPCSVGPYIFLTFHVSRLPALPSSLRRPSVFSAMLTSHLLWATVGVRGPLGPSVLVFSFSSQPLRMSEHLGRVSDSVCPVHSSHLSVLRQRTASCRTCICPLSVQRLHPEQVPSKGGGVVNGAEVTARQTGHPPASSHILTTLPCPQPSFPNSPASCF